MKPTNFEFISLGKSFLVEMDVEKLLECLVASIGREILVSYRDFVGSLTLYKSAEEAERAPFEVAARVYNSFREYSVTLLEHRGRLYPVIKPGTFWGSEGCHMFRPALKSSWIFTRIRDSTTSPIAMIWSNFGD